MALGISMEVLFESFNQGGSPHLHCNVGDSNPRTGVRE